MKADAIIFDKDGTLIDFDAFWVSVSIRAVTDVLHRLGREDIPVDEILTGFGVRDGVTDVNSVLCKGTYEQMGQIVHACLEKYGCHVPCEQVIAMVSDGCKESAGTGIIKPTDPRLADTLRALKKKNKKLAVVTTDNGEITAKCLQGLGVEELFDKIFTDDGETPLKPDPYCAEAFAQFAGVDKDRLVVVGDTLTDMKFAKNAGIPSIGLAKTREHRQILEPYADVVIEKISDLADLIQ